MLIDFPSTMSTILAIWLCQLIKSRLLQIQLLSPEKLPIVLTSLISVTNPQYTRSVLSAIIPINPEYMSLISFILSMVFMRSLARRLLKRQKIPYVIAFALVAAGTISNALDRLTINGALDYIYIQGIGILCNVEDVIIITGYLTYVISYLVYFIKDKFRSRSVQIANNYSVQQIKDLPSN